MKVLSSCIFLGLAAVLGQAASVSVMAQQSDIAAVTSPALPEAPQPQSYQRGDAIAALRSIDDPGRNVAPDSEGAVVNRNSGGISGTVTDLNGDLVPGVRVMLDGPQPEDHSEVVANDNAAFEFDALKSGVPYRVSIHVNGFSDWASDPIILTPGQHKILTGIELRVEAQQASVTVYGSTEQIALEQVRLEEQQRVLGIIPNFYVVYDSKDAVPLTTKLKFKLALRVSVDPVTIGGVSMMAGINQAADRPNFVQGAQGYGQRFGAIAADSFSDILIGGAILPSVLHQDPRYFYQGTGSTGSRLKHAVFSPFICRGDNGQTQVNYSSLGGDLISSALSNTYYPDSNRGAGLVFGTFAIGTAERMVSGIAQEFILPKLTKTKKDF